MSSLVAGDSKGEFGTAGLSFYLQAMSTRANTKETAIINEADELWSNKVP